MSGHSYVGDVTHCEWVEVVVVVRECRAALPCVCVDQTPGLEAQSTFTKTFVVLNKGLLWKVKVVIKRNYCESNVYES